MEHECWTVSAKAGRWATVAVLGLSLMACSSEPPPLPPAPESPSAPKAMSTRFPEGWTSLPAPPEVLSSSSTAWTGSTALTWGGYLYTGSSDKPPSASGYAFDAKKERWTALPTSPLAPRSSAGTGWTGSELLIWGGFDGTWKHGRPGAFADGAAYDPSTREWRMLPPAPLEARMPLSVWTGHEFIVWGTAWQIKSEAPRDGAAYDPRTDTWRTIAEAPIGLTDANAVWTGREMIVLGAFLRNGRSATTDTSIGAAYNPSRDEWRTIADAPITTGDSTAWNGHEMIAWDYEQNSAAYDPVSDQWHTLPRVPLPDYECLAEGVGLDDSVIVDFCSGLALLDRTGKWSVIKEARHAVGVLAFIPTQSALLVLNNDYDGETTGMSSYRPGRPPQ